ncbi:MAG TPA: lysophospholipid acyltransferase family protein [Fimbriimonadaceae bacterium]|nr:lysophospholipid acyltransferase family protein [Fimbriimonadaceae bacterium]HRJ32122.1 lysophospholipid acyltransferase family protein [Fimbriimonadaceae bacterium]
MDISRQEQGFLGRQVGAMIRRSVRRRFRNVYWMPPALPLPQGPKILVANHHGWFDGYLMFLLIQELHVVCRDWIAEFDSFPLFAKIGGMPFPPDSPERRMQTIRETIRWMRQGGSMVLFAEGVLHDPPEILPLGSGLATLCRKVPGVHVVPVAIHYLMSLHERPEAFLRVGPPRVPGEDVLSVTQADLGSELTTTQQEASLRLPKWKLLHAGTPSVNERWDVRKFKR